MAAAIRVCLLVAAAISSNCAFAMSSSPLDKIRLDKQGVFRDQLGRARLFRGVNAVFKEPPWLPTQDKGFDPFLSLAAEDAALLKQWGFNMVRLGVMWPGVEPAPGSFDTSYLDSVSKLTETLAKYGVFTLLDMHQDLLSRRYCGEGLPEHYVDAILKNSSSRLAQAQDFPFPVQFEPMPVNDSGYPALEDCLKSGNFANFYATVKVGALFAELYDNSTELHAGFLRYWSHVAGHFAAAGPHILGYELLNEPSALCLDGPTSCVHPGAFWQKFEDSVMAPLYREAAQEIRSFDADRPIFYESSIYPKLNSDLFSTLPLGNDSQQVYAYHIYCNPGHGWPSRQICHNMQDLYMHNDMDFLQKNTLGGFMTEFGAIGDEVEDEDNIRRLLDLADEHFQSWAYWSFKDYHDFTTMEKNGPLYDSEGKLEVRKLKMLSRTYAVAVAGTPTRHFFSPETGKFELSFLADKKGSEDEAAITEVYLNEELHYPAGYNVTFTPPNCLSVQKPERNRVDLCLASSCIGTLVEVEITAHHHHENLFV